MKTINRSNIPTDFNYYRTSSQVFYEYYKNYGESKIILTGEKYNFFKINRIFGFNLWTIFIEKIDIEIKMDLIKSLNINHGIIARIPKRTIDKPKGWLKMPLWMTKDLAFSSRSAFCILDKKEYWTKWSSRARNSRNKALKLIKENKITIEKTNNLNVFLSIYSLIKSEEPNYKWNLEWCKNSLNQENIIKKIRVYLAKVDDKILAGSVFIDEGVTSEYFMSFCLNEGKPYQLGIAIINNWFSDSYSQGIKYCDLDHMRDVGQLDSFSGYTKFKESIADYDVYFHDLWIKFF